MESVNRKLGIDALDVMPWGSHVCYFYNTKQDLIDILVPYFQAGLENNESCIWITSESLRKEESEEAMGKVMSDFSRYLASQQIEIIPATEWYFKGGTFQPKRALNAWIDKLERALASGYDGMRLSGDTAWLESADWNKFTDYEERVNNTICNYHMLALCTYPLHKYGASEIIDVERAHQYSIIKHKGELALIGGSEYGRTEEVLQENRDYLERLTNSMWDAFFSIKMPERVIAWANDSFRLFGYEPKECIGRTTEFLYADKSEFLTFGNKLENAMTAGKDILHTEQLLKRKNGEVFSAEINTTFYREKGEVVRVTSIVRDITEQKQAEEDKNKLLSTIETAREAICTVSPELIIESTNEAMDNLFGYKKGELIGKHVSICNAGQTPDLVAKQIANVLEKEGRWEGEVFNRRKDGTEFLSYATLSAHKNQDGKIISYLSTQHDITERKQAEEKLQLSYRILEIDKRHKELVPMLKEFVSAIKSFTGCAAVGIRILDIQGNIPYQAYDGFSRKFYESESLLSIKSDKCMCIYVIRGDIDPGLPFCTERGSFYMNGTTRFLATISEEEKGETRNVCNEYGYESVALVPIELKDRTLGLIHVADPRENMVPLKIVEILETVAVQLGIAIRRVRAEESRKMLLQATSGKDVTPLQKRFIREGLRDLSESAGIRLIFNLCRYRPECDKNIKKCINQFKSVRALLSASDQELQQVGVCPRGLFAVKLFRELPAEVLKQKIMERSIYKSSREVFDYLYYSMRDLKNEVFKVIYLNNRSQIIDVVDLFEGTKDSIHVHPREIVESALANGATGLIFVHNHPTGDPTPSKTDKQLTRELVFVGMILQIKVLDHIIIGENSYFSFADDGLIQKYEDNFLSLKIRGVLASGPIYQHYDNLPRGLHFQRQVNTLSNIVSHLGRK